MQVFRMGRSDPDLEEQRSTALLIGPRPQDQRRAWLPV